MVGEWRRTSTSTRQRGTPRPAERLAVAASGWWPSENEAARPLNVANALPEPAGLNDTERTPRDLSARKHLKGLQCADHKQVFDRPFHNGSAADLKAVVDFYDERFNIGLNKQDKADLPRATTPATTRRPG